MEINKKVVIFSLTIIVAVSLFFHFYKKDQIPPCLNADEAAYGYNSYSLLKTGKDEFGKFLPLRLLSFKDYKLPLYSYLSMPIIGILGLNDFSIRLLNVFVGIALVILSYFLAKEIFNNKLIGILSSLLVSLNPAVYLLSRQAQEGVLCAFFTLLSLYFFIKYWKKQRNFYFFGIIFSMFLASFSYHTARIFLIFFSLALIYALWKHRIKKNIFFNKSNVIKIFILAVILIIPFYVDFTYGNNRVTNLLFIQNKGFQLKLNEYLNEHGLRILHNKLTQAVRDITERYFTQISPEFFLVTGDKNWRFGMPGLSIFTPIEFILFFVGLFFLFKNKQEYHFILLLFLALIPINNALTWMEPALNRTYLIIFPVLYIVSYGIIQLLNINKKNKLFLIVSIIIVSLHSFYLLNSWDLYFNHYPKRALNIRAWQCGYKEMAKYIKDNYNQIDKFYITDRQGDPYIFVLTYLAYDPYRYQQQFKIFGPDDYGFGQIETFDKFDFKFKYNPLVKNTVSIGYPDEFKDLNIPDTRIQKIKIGTEEMFWIYRN